MQNSTPNPKHALIYRARRAVSPVIATVLIVALVVAAVAIVAVIVMNSSDITEEMQIQISESYGCDFDADGELDALLFTIDNLAQEVATLTDSTFELKNAAGETIPNWEYSSASDISLGGYRQGTVMIYSKTSMNQVAVGAQFTFELTLSDGTKESFTTSVSSITPSSPLHVEATLTVEDLFPFRTINALAGKPGGLDNYAPTATEALEGATVSINDAVTGIPVCPSQDTDNLGTAVFRIRPGVYNATVRYDLEVKGITQFVYPDNLDDIGIQTMVRSVNFVETRAHVTVQYKEFNQTMPDATVTVQRQIDGYPVVVEDRENTDVLGEADFMLPVGDYKFTAHKDGGAAPSNWVDISVTDYVQIHVEPGIVFVQVLAADRTPIPNLYTYVYAVQGNMQSFVSAGRTNSTGWLAVSVGSPNFRLRVQCGGYQYSPLFKVVPGATYEFVLGGNTLNVRLQDTGAVGVGNIYMYLYDEYGRYQGYMRTNSTGWAPFYGLSDGDYYVRYYYCGGYSYSDTITVTEDTQLILTVSGATVYIHIMDADGVGIANRYCYAYNVETGVYSGYAYTNSTGYATMPLTEGDTFYVRTYHYSGSSWQYLTSEDFVASSGLVVEIVFGNEEVVLHVEDDLGVSLTYTYVYMLVGDSGDTQYSYAYLDSNGNATFLLPSKRIFRAAVIMGGGIANGTAFNCSETHSVVLVVDLADFTVRCRNEQDQILTNGWVYLYGATTQWNYIGRSDLNATGEADFRALETGMYKVYVYARSPTYTYFYSGNFTITEGCTVLIQPVELYLRVQTDDGDLIPNSYIQIYTLQNSYAGWGRTDANGIATVKLMNNTLYKARIYYGGFTQIFTAVAGQTIDVILQADAIQVLVQDEQGEAYHPPSTWYSVYARYENGSTAGWAYLNATGGTTIFLAENTTCRLTMYVSGREILTDLFNVNETNTIVIMILHGVKVYVTVTDGTNPIPDRYTYLYTTYGTYGGYAYTNASGVATFSFVAPGEYYARIWSNGYFKSDPFNVTDTGDVYVEIELEPVALNIYVRDHNGAAVVDSYVYLYDYEGYWCGYDRTNASGIATINGYQNKLYTARAYISAYSQYVSTSLFNFTADITTIHINATRYYVAGVDGSGAPTVNFYVTMQSNGSRIWSYARTNSSGIATVYSANGSTMMLALAKNSWSYLQWFYPVPVDIEADKVINIDIGGGTVYVRVTDSSGEPIANSYTYLYTSGMMWTGFYTQTNSTGYAVFVNIGDGYYVAWSSSLGIYSSEFHSSHNLVVELSPPAMMPSPLLQMINDNWLAAEAPKIC